MSSSVEDSSLSIERIYSPERSPDFVLSFEEDGIKSVLGQSLESDQASRTT